MSSPSLFTFSNAQSWAWGVQGNSGSHNTEGIATAIDKEDNVFLVGYYFDSLSFGSFLLTSGSANAFIVKYDSNDNLLWAEQPTSTNQSQGYGVATDKSGNSFIVGYFSGSLTFGTYILSTSNRSDAPFLAKYSPSGNVIWAEQGLISVSGDGICESIATDARSNVYITGFFSDTITFGTYTLSTLGNTDYFLVKYDSNGNVIWAEQGLRSNKGTSFCESVKTDAINNVYITGAFIDTLTLGSSTLISNVGQDLFIAKFDTSGNLLWASQTTVTSSNCLGNGLSIAIDILYNAYLTGYFIDRISFGSYTLTNSNSVKGCIFLAKYNPMGNVLWAESSKAIDTNYWEAYSLAIDDTKHVYLSGGCSNGYYPMGKPSVVFGTDTFSLSDVTDPAIVVKFDSNGNVLCGSIIGSGGDDQNGISADPSGKYVYFGGDLVEPIFFGPDTIGPMLPPSCEYPFIARWHANCDSKSAINNIIPNQEQINIYPNPCTNTLNIDLETPSNLSSIQITDITGRVLLTYSLPLSPYPLPLDVSALAPGMYFIRINSGSATEVRKFIKE